jgi:uncharacterized membrane protein (UPF0182 family)
MSWRPGRRALFLGLGILVTLILAGAAAGIYTESLWYGSLGYGSVYWTRIRVAVLVQGAAAAIAAALVFANLLVVSRHAGAVRVRRRFGNIEIAEQIPRRFVLTGIVVIAVAAGWWLAAMQFGGGASLGVYAWLQSVPWGLADPVFGRDAAFYVFALPVRLRAVDFLVLALLWSGMLAAAGYALAGSMTFEENRVRLSDPARLHLVGVLASLVALLAIRIWLSRYELLLDDDAIGGSLGYTDVRARLPARIALTLVALGAAAALAFGAIRRTWTAPLVAGGVLVAGMVVGGFVVPGLVQRFEVEPNELARETPWIRWNMEFTRRAYGLSELDVRPTPYAPPARTDWSALWPQLASLPLWDREPLRTAYNQLQAFVDYYRFLDVDFARYADGDGAQHQVAIAVREVDPSGIPEDARTWRTLHLNPLYIRGVGAVVTPAAEANDEGEPSFWLRNQQGASAGTIEDPSSIERARDAPVAVRLTDPDVFFGEATRGYAVLVPGMEGEFTGEAGLDYPEGVQLDSFLRVAAFAWRFGDMNLLFAGEIDDASRMLFRRAIDERVGALAPFLLWDGDPYPVVSGGRIHWIIDGYAASGSFPIARRHALQGVGDVRYLSHGVKAVVDAVTGEVGLYAIGAADPIVATFQRVFPGLIRPEEDFPPELRPHLRYPPLYLKTQAEIFASYHLGSPEAFYAGRDFWQVPAAGAEGPGVTYRPDFAVMALPGEAPEFLLSVPLVARDRENMAALLLARNDDPRYGELVLLELPRDQLVPGPGQVLALTEQDPAISERLSLWRQRGSDVDLGQMLVVPLAGSFLYVQPVFISSEDEETRIPRLEQVVVSDGRSVSMAPNLRAAIQGLGGGPAPARGEDPAGMPERRPPADWPAEAMRLLEEADARLRAGDFSGFGERWEALRDVLRAASEDTGG